MTAPSRNPLQPDAAFVEVAVPLPLARPFSYRVPSGRADEVEPGRVVRVPFGRRTLVGVVTERVGRPDLPRVRELEEILPDPYVLGSEQRELAAWVADYYACTPGEALSLLLPPRPATAARKSPLSPEGVERARPELTEPQHEAFEAVRRCQESGSFGSFLLHGVTGSGKTEVYLRLIEEALARGQGALLLLPEIALTPQTLGRLRDRLPGRFAPYHSRLSHGERCAVWEAAARGEVPVVVGARSAVFTPIRNLGLILVDEEHEPSYKSDERPRYHGRDVAILRARQRGIPIVLGSATPSLESWHNARAGKHRLLELPRRVGADRLPAVRIVDRRGPEAGEPLGPELSEALEETLDRGEQAIVFHNRRGFARFLQCRSCGHVLPCPRCDISLTYHLKDDRLHCHYCGHRRAVPPACPECREPVLHPRGSGTQRVEVALQARFPRARVLRLDQDSTGRKGDHDRILKTFERGEADILLGTQMVAKGLHFPGVTLVGVVDADAGLHFPDFRAHERSFQLLTQVAGRSGRTGPGTVLLQTYDPEHRVLRRVLEHDVAGFLEEELAQRQALGYPPVRRLAAITVTAPTEELLESALEQLARRIEAAVQGSGIELLGPARAALGRINRRWRGQILLKGGLSAAGKRSVVAIFEALGGELRGGRRLDLALDVDPLHLL